MNAVAAGPVLALQISAGTTGFFVVVLLCLAAAGIFAMMSRSLKRMRGNIERGEFHGTDEPPATRQRTAAHVPSQDDRAGPGGD